MLQQPVGGLTRQQLVAKLAIGCAGLLVVCCVCSVPISILNSSPDSSTDAGRAERSNTVLAARVGGAPAAPEPTAPPEPTAMPTASGATRTDPIPMGTGATIQGDMTVTVLEVTRFMDAVVSNGNMWNSKPGAGEEYIQVVLQIECQRSSNDICSIFTRELKLVGQDGIVLKAEPVAGIDDVLDSGEFFGGSIRVGRLFFIVPQQAAGLLLFHDPRLFGSEVFFALP